jgi:hypothetical protein
MTPAIAVTLLGICVSAIVALVIAAMQRKQMRQIEMYNRPVCAAKAATFETHGIPKNLN